MFTEMLKAEVWRKRLETAGYRVVTDAWAPAADEPPRDPGERRSFPGDRPNRPR